MASYLVRAKPKPGKLLKLKRKLDLGDIALMRGFGESLQSALRKAKTSSDGDVFWEQKSHSAPPLSQEKRAILNEFFREVVVEEVSEGQGWERVRHLEPLWAD